LEYNSGMDDGFVISESILISLFKMKSQTLYLLGQITKFSFFLCVFQFFIISIANAQDNNWQVTVYGGKGSSYETAPVIKGYLIVNSKDLKGLVYRTYLKNSSLDTLLNSDTLYGRIKLYILGENIDIELSKTNVVSVPCSYVLSVVGTSYEKYYTHVPLTRWVILSPDKYLPFGRLIARKNNVLIYDSSKKDTVDGGYVCPMTLNNGYEEIEIFNRFYSTNKTLVKFIKKRYGVDLSSSKEDLKNTHFLVDYILEQENSSLDKKRKSK
jgi:hypothetical protein